MSALKRRDRTAARRRRCLPDGDRLDSTGSVVGLKIELCVSKVRPLEYQCLHGRYEGIGDILRIRTGTRINRHRIQVFRDSIGGLLRIDCLIDVTDEADKPSVAVKF